VREQQPEKVVVAVPVGAASTCREFQHIADEVACTAMPDNFYAVGLWYNDFTPTTDEEVRDLLSKADQRSLSDQTEMGVHNGAI
jgi:predicted phosphoribosyltransferase